MILPRLAAYFAGEADMVEVHAIEAWVQGGEERAAWVESVRRIWLAAATDGTAFDPEAAWARFQTQRSGRASRTSPDSEVTGE